MTAARIFIKALLWFPGGNYIIARHERWKKKPRANPAASAAVAKTKTTHFIMVLFALCRIASLLIGLSVLAACSHDIGLMKMDEQTNLYGSAIRWGAFQRALEFHEFVPNPPPDPRLLQNIKVTGYQTLFQDLNDDRRKLLQTVEIRYVRLDDLVERNFTQEQTWLYDEKKDQWRLWSDFPKFR